MTFKITALMCPSGVALAPLVSTSIRGMWEKILTREELENAHCGPDGDVDRIPPSSLPKDTNGIIGSPPCKPSSSTSTRKSEGHEGMQAYFSCLHWAATPPNLLIHIGGHLTPPRWSHRYGFATLLGSIVDPFLRHHEII